MIDRFRRIDAWVQDAPQSLIVLIGISTGIGLFVLAMLIAWAMR
jgi:2-phosphoglycerate kinase